MKDAADRLRYWLKKAQPAPWETVEVPCEKSGVRYELYAADHDVAQQFWSEASAEFCAAARNLLPEVLAELDALRAENERLRGLIRQYVHATDEFAVDDSSETQSRYERTEDALREVARG